MKKKTRFIFELTTFECAEICEQKSDCTKCPLYFSHGVCAKDIAFECDELGMRELLRYLLKEVEL